MESFISNSDTKDFSNPSYWQKFYEKTPDAFEWYGNYQQLSKIFETYLNPKNAILQIGCGNSALAEELYDNGFRNVRSIDTDSKVIKKQQSRQATKRPTLKFDCCSADNTSAEASSIDTIIDKGTLDAVMSDVTENNNLITSIFNEIDRCLKPFGRYIAITLAQEHVLTTIVNYFQATKRHIIRIRKCESLDESFCMPVFAIIVTKMPNVMPKIPDLEFERTISDKSKFERKTRNSIEKADNFEAFLTLVKAEQEFNWLKHNVARRSVKEEISFKIYDSNNQPKYELFLIDSEEEHKVVSFGVFIVPLERNADWMYCTKKGRKILLKQTGRTRLIVTQMFKGTTYGDMTQIQNDLHEFVVGLKPKKFTDSQIDFLSLGNGKPQNVVVRGSTKINGDWWIEDGDYGDGTYYRQLIFKDSAGMIQSEAELKKGKKGKFQIRSDYLVCGHHRIMLSTIDLFKKAVKLKTGSELDELKSPMKLVVLGLGGGLLPKYLYEHFSKAIVTVVEYDSDVLVIAKKYFGFPEANARLKIEIDDAFNFLKNCSTKEEWEKHDVIMVDLATNMNEQGISCPPPNFLTHEALNLMKESLRTNGVLALNLVTRDEEAAKHVKSCIQKHFPRGYTIGSDEDVNEVLICPSNQELVANRNGEPTIDWVKITSEGISNILLT